MCSVIWAVFLFFFFFFKQKTAYEMRISDWSSDVCSSDLRAFGIFDRHREEREVEPRPEPADEEHHFGRDEQDHAVAQVQLDDRGVVAGVRFGKGALLASEDRKSTRLNSSH